MKTVLISVSSDLCTDQRLHRLAATLHRQGLYVKVIGRKKKKSAEPEKRNYKTKRVKLWWEKGPMFYASFNLYLFFFLLFHKADVLVANDLDTLLPNFLISKIKGTELFYDSHEYFTEVPELVNRKGIQRIWKNIEKFIFPKLKNIYTVNDSIAQLYKNEYHVDVKVVRNIPMTKNISGIKIKSRRELGLPEDKKIILMQGAAINIDRGAEETLLAMQHLDGAVLYFVGGGDVFEKLKQMRDEFHLEEKVFFIPKLPQDELFQFTKNADVGLTLDKDNNINYRFSLPNKLFDYIHAGIPVLASPLPEIKKIIDEFQIGMLIENHQPEHIAGCLKKMISDNQQYEIWKRNLLKAASMLTWETEEKKLLKIYGFEKQAG